MEGSGTKLLSADPEDVACPWVMVIPRPTVGGVWTGPGTTFRYPTIRWVLLSLVTVMSKGQVDRKVAGRGTG